MAEGQRFNIWISTSLKAQLERSALRLSKTQGAIVREALVTYLASHAEDELEKKHGGLRISTKQLAVCFAQLKVPFSIKRKIYYLGGGSQTSRIVFYSVKGDK